AVLLPLNPVSALQVCPRESVYAGPPALTRMGVKPPPPPPLAFTVKERALLLPLAVVAVTECAPVVAVAAMVSVAVICAAVDATFDTVTPVPLTASEAPLRLLPASVTETAVP